MSVKLKFKLYDKKKNKIVDYIDRSIAIADGTVQSFDRSGNLEGTAANVHLTPLLYASKKDIKEREIYDGFIVKREAAVPGDEEIIGVVEFMECSWWIVNKKQKRAVRLFSETAIDLILGNIYQNPKLYEVAGYE